MVSSPTFICSGLSPIFEKNTYIIEFLINIHVCLENGKISAISFQVSFIFFNTTVTELHPFFFNSGVIVSHATGFIANP